MSGAPDPLVPSGVDLTDFAFIPMHIERLRRSRAWLICKRRPELAFYLLNLWMRAWHEQPAGSLEDDDDVLADAAMIEPKRWLRLRDDLLRGWVKCSDGRLYHPVVAELAIEANDRKRTQRGRTEAARQALMRARGAAATEGDKRKNDHPTKSVAETPTASVTDIATGSKGQGQGQGQGEGQGQGIEAGREGDAPAARGPSTRDPAPQTSLLDVPTDLDRTPLKAAVVEWNHLAEQHGLSRVQILTEPRQRALRRRLADAGGLEGWRAALAKVAASKFLTGGNDRGWRADFDFVVREAAFTKLMEGKYDDREPRDDEQFRNGFYQLFAEGRV